MKEVNMKKLLFWIVLIVGIVALVGSCAKKDDSESTASTASTASVTSCSDTASGSITGIDNQSVSGTYSVMLQYVGYGDIDNDTGCTTNTTLLSNFSSKMPTGAVSFNQLRVVTSSTSFADVYKSYSDTACSSEMASLVIGNTDVTIGDNVTGLTTGDASIGTTGTKATAKQYCQKGKGTTDNGTAWLNSFTSGSGLTYVTGEEKITAASGDTYYHLWHSDNTSKKAPDYSSFIGNSWRARVSSSAYPTDWTDSGAIDAFQR
jgi:hypothetical protein